MSKDQSGPPPLTPISPDNQAHVKEGCEDRCVKSDPCQHGGQCFDDFDRFTCDCSQTEHEGTDCSVPGWCCSRTVQKPEKPELNWKKMIGAHLIYFICISADWKWWLVYAFTESSLVTLTGANYIVFDGRHSVAAGNLYLGYSRISLDFKVSQNQFLLIKAANVNFPENRTGVLSQKCWYVRAASKFCCSFRQEYPTIRSGSKINLSDKG